MGYLSQVAIALTKNGVNELNKRLSEAEEDTKEAVRGLLGDQTDTILHGPDGSELYFWRFVKWYEDDPVYFPDVLFFQESFHCLRASDYLFLRVGEDYDDAETRGSYWNNPFGLKLFRSLEFFPAQKRGAV